MKSIFKKITYSFGLFFKYCFTLLRNFFHFFKFVFLKDKKALFYSLLFLAFNAASVSLLLFSCEYLPNSREITLSEIADDFDKSEGYYPNGIIYYDRITNNTDISNNRSPELTKELRNTFSEVTCFDLYYANWNDISAPAIINKDSENEKRISLCAWPYSDFYLGTWTYEMPTVIKFGSGKMNSSNDLFITADYAYKLLEDEGKTSDQISYLDGKLISIPYSYKSTKNSNPVFSDCIYKIRGVIDDNSKQYLNLKNRIGDFFIVSEYFSMPFPCQTYFKFSSRGYGNVVKYSKILKDFEYSSYISYSNFTYANSAAYQCRVTFFGDYSSLFSIENIFNNPSKYNTKTNKLFDSYTTPSYILYCGLFIFLHIAFLSLVLLFSLKIKKLASFDEQLNVNFKYFRPVLISSILLSVSFGTLMAILLHNISFLSSISLSNYIGITAMIIETVLLFVFLLKSKWRKSV